MLNLLLYSVKPLPAKWFNVKPLTRDSLILNHIHTGRWQAQYSAQEAHGAPRFSLTITMTYTEEYP